MFDMDFFNMLVDAVFPADEQFFFFLQITQLGDDRVGSPSWSLPINKDNECIECNEILNELEENKNQTGTWSIFVGKEIIGAGNEELGKSLMKMFFYTIAEDTDLPKSILFMNDGVKVPTLNEQAIEHLKELEAKGVEILTCGACLNFYKLENELKAGKVSNMYDITKAMKESSKVITL